MPSTRPHSQPDREHNSPTTSDFNTPLSSPSGQHTPAAGYRTAAGTISSVFASFWGSHNQPSSSSSSQQQQQYYDHQQRQSGPSRLQPPSSNSTPHDSPSPSIPGGWGNLLSWGPSAGRQKTTTLRKSASPSRASPSKSSRSRGAIPFAISAPLEAGNIEKVDSNHVQPVDTPSVQPLQRRADTVASHTRSPTSSPHRRPLAGIFEGLPSSSTSPPLSPSSSSPASPRTRFRDPTPSSPSFIEDSPGGAYATLSRLQSKPSVSKLRSGSGFLWPSATPEAATTDKMPVATLRGRATTAAANWSEAIAKVEKLDSHVRRIIFQAGLDYETRPMVVLAACFLPDPSEVDYDALLDRIMDAMDLFVENDYTVVYFASGGEHKPGWSWIWRAYRRLDRRFRKNLKKLYIVHPTFFTRSLLQFVNTGAYFVSPKFSKKVSQLTTLSALAEHVPLTQVDIPPEVLQWNLKYEQQITIPSSPDLADEHHSIVTEKVFGVDLVRLMGEFGEGGDIPRVVRDCVEAILGDFDGIRPAEVEGIFRRSPSSALLKTAEASYDRGHPVSLEQYHDPHIPAVLLKVFLRKLPQPIFPSSMYGMIRACPPPPPASSSDIDEQANAQARETIDYLRTRLLPAIEPACAGILLSYVLEMLHKVSQHVTSNKMDASNLATVIAPNLVSSGNAMKDMLICRVEGINSMSSPTHKRTGSLSSTTTESTTLGSILRFCIERYYEIFDEPSSGAPINNVQNLVDYTPHVYSPGSAQLNGSPRVLVRGMDEESISASLGLTWIRPGEQTQGGEEGVVVEDDRSSRATTASIASRGYRAPAGFHRGTIGRNSSGSLRLTRGRLGSNTNLRSSFTPVTPGIRAQTSSLATTPAGGDTDGLTSQLSGVALTDTPVTATFSSPSASRREPMTAEGVDGGEVESSPVLTGGVGRHHRQQSGEAEIEVGAGTRRSNRRELSEVAEQE